MQDLVAVEAELDAVWDRCIGIAKESARCSHGKTFDNTGALMVVAALEAAHKEKEPQK